MIKLIIPIIFLTFSCSSNKKEEVIFKGKEPSSLDIYSEKKIDQISESDFSLDPRYKFEDERFSKKGMSFIQSESMLRLGYDEFKSISSISGPLTKALRECVSGKKKKAYQYFDYLFKYYRLKSSYWVYRGNCSFHLKDYERSIRFYLKAKNLGGKKELINNNLAVVYIKRGNLLKAKKLLLELGEQNIRGNSILFNQALVYTSFGYFKKSQSILAKILEKNFSDDDVLFLAGKNYLNLSDSVSALGFLERISQSKLSRFDYGLVYARALFENNNNKKALVILSRIKLVSPTERKAVSKLREKYREVN
jgi:Flp pilus assembly protein TadD